MKSSDISSYVLTLSPEASALGGDPPLVFFPRGTKFRLTHRRLAEGGQPTDLAIFYMRCCA